MYRVSKRGISNFGTHPSLKGTFNNRVVVNAPGQTEVKNKEILITQMSNGARVITQELDQPTSAIGFYCLAGGAKFDPRSKPGLNYVMRYALMTSSMADSHFQLDRAVRHVGASIEHQEIRKQALGWKLEVRRDAFEKPFNCMQACMAVPRFAESDTNRFRDTMDAVYEELRWQNPRAFVADALEQTAFYKETCGNPRYVPPSANDDCSHEALLAQYCRFYVPENIVIAGVNIDHSSLLSAYENAAFPHSSKSPHHRDAEKVLTGAGEQKQYTPGRDDFHSEKRYKDMSTKPFLENETIVALGWRTAGYDTLKDYATSLVLQSMIDAKVHDGLRVEQSNLERGLRSFYNPLSTVGLIGMTSRTDPKDAAASVKDAAALMKSVVEKDALPGAIQRAQLRFLHDNVETRRDYIDFLAMSIGNSGSKQIRSVAGTLDAIKSVSLADVQAALKDSLSTAPCMYSMGAVDELPSLRQMGF